MPARPADGRNPTKTRQDAKDSKKKVALNKVEQVEEWRKKRDKNGAKIDKMLTVIAKRAKEIGEATKRQEDTKKALEDLGEMIQGAMKELKTMQEVPVKGDLPKVPANLIGLGSMLPVIIAMVAWWNLVKKVK